MKPGIKIKWKFLLVVCAPFLISGLCSRSNDEPPLPSNADEYVTWQMSVSNSWLAVPTDSVNGGFAAYNINRTAFAAWNYSNSKNIYLGWLGLPSAGNFAAENFLLHVNGKNYVPSTTPLQVNLSQYDSPGGYIIGAYSGIVRDSSSTTTYNITGQFRVQRSY